MDTKASWRDRFERELRKNSLKIAALAHYINALQRKTLHAWKGLPKTATPFQMPDPVESKSPFGALSPQALPGFDLNTTATGPQVPKLQEINDTIATGWRSKHYDSNFSAYAESTTEARTRRRRSFSRVPSVGRAPLFEGKRRRSKNSARSSTHRGTNRILNIRIPGTSTQSASRESTL